jgi:hypothetical protein
MKTHIGSGFNKSSVVVSLCDYSGNWPRPWIEAGHTVVQYDLKHGDDVTSLTGDQIMRDIAATGTAVDTLLGNAPQVLMVLAAPPCTDFSVSGAQYWPQKDANGTTDKALAVLDACVRLVNELEPVYWMLENPVGRLGKLRPSLGKPFYFQPHQYARYAPDKNAELYTKKTGIWGCFEKGLMEAAKDLEAVPVRVCAQGSWLQKLGGKSERTKELRSMTPQGFARAVYLVHTLGS